MQVVYFETRRPDNAQDDIHQKATASMQALAESIDGFVLWRDHNEGLTYWGVVMFETEAGAIAWRDDSSHAAINDQSRGQLYSAFRTIACNSVREASFGFD